MYKASEQSIILGKVHEMSNGFEALKTVSSLFKSSATYRLYWYKCIKESGEYYIFTLTLNGT